MARHTDGEHLFMSLAGISLAVGLIGLYFVGRFLYTALTELVTVYAESGSLPIEQQRAVWWALAAFAGLLGMCALIALAVPAAVGGALFVACAGFLTYVVAVECMDWWGRRHLPPAGSLEAHLPKP